MKILSIHDGHNATACLMVEGAVVSMVSEERFTNRKNQGGYPEHSVRWILGENALRPGDIDHVVFPHIISPIDFARTYGTHYSPRHVLFHFANIFMPRTLIGSNKLIGPYIRAFRGVRRSTIRRYAGKYGFDHKRIRQVEHHDTHGYGALYGSGFHLDGGPVLVFTLDGSGDGISGRVAVWDKEKGMATLHEDSSFHSVGELYSRVTQFLGMKAGEHEYKLMGMAPYVPDDKSEPAFRRFLSYLDFDPATGGFVNRKYFGQAILPVLKKDFSFERFDNVCAGIQRHYEHVVTRWVRHWAKNTGIRTAVFGGGCFMNVKCNMLIAAFDELDKVYFTPSSGDESTAVGAAYKVAADVGEKEIKPLESLYLGPRFEDAEVGATLKGYEADLLWEKHDDIERKVAELLRDGHIVGRFRGPAEWGARALGGRSILCRADDLRIIHRLNKSIKSRDFWMPFAASIIEEDAERYILNPKRLAAPHMILTFDTTDKAREEIAAGLHPFDHTCRPQLVSKKANPSYYRLLQHFRELTGFSGLLNTSFNLHGFPIVGSPEMAMRTLLDSGLDFVAIESFLVRRKPQQ